MYYVLCIMENVLTTSASDNDLAVVVLAFIDQFGVDATVTSAQLRAHCVTENIGNH